MLEKYKLDKLDSVVKSEKETINKLDNVVDEVVAEYFDATMKFGEFKSRHDAIGIIEEEFLELRAAAFWPHKLKPEDDDAYTEAKQLAAMALRYMVDIGKGRDGSHGNER